MARKKYTAAEVVTPELLSFREKRKWQINFRRYVVEQQACPAYAAYFGLDIPHIRQWMECQFRDEMSWETFGKHWQFEHVVPVTYFNFSLESDLIMCWNFTNIRAELIGISKERGGRLQLEAARLYFQKLVSSTAYPVSVQLLRKLNEIGSSEQVDTSAQELFLTTHQQYLEQIRDYSRFEFELLNSGKTPDEVNRELALIGRLSQ